MINCQLSTYITKYRDHFNHLCRGENETVILFELSGNKKLPTELAAQLGSIFSIPTLQRGEVVTAHRFNYFQGRLPENGRIIHVCVHHEPTASYKGALYCTDDSVINYARLLDAINHDVFKYESNNLKCWSEGIARSPAFSLDGRELSSLTHFQLTTSPEDLPSLVGPSNAGSTFTLKINFPETLLQRAKNNIDDILANFGISKSTELKWAKDTVTFPVSCDANVNPQNMADMLNTVLKSEISMCEFYASIESDKPVCSNSPNDTNSSMPGASDISSKELIGGSSKPNIVRRMGRAALTFLNLDKSSQHSYAPEANL